MDDKAVREFGERYLDCLIATDAVARGTGPAKFSSEPYGNVVVFDTTVLREDELPPIWNDPDVKAARTLGHTHPDNRDLLFERIYAESRRAVWKKFGHLFSEAREPLLDIRDHEQHAAREDEFNSLRLNYVHAGHRLDLLNSGPTFEDAMRAITGGTVAVQENYLNAKDGR